MFSISLNGHYDSKRTKVAIHAHRSAQNLHNTDPSEETQRRFDQAKRELQIAYETDKIFIRHYQIGLSVLIFMTLLIYLSMKPIPSLKYS